jgi:hypothetical protein
MMTAKPISPKATDLPLSKKFVKGEKNGKIQKGSTFKRFFMGHWFSFLCGRSFGPASLLLGRLRCGRLLLQDLRGESWGNAYLPAMGAL